MKFIIDSDFHFKNGQIRIDKEKDIKTIIELCNEENIKIILAIGDLTDNGTDEQCNDYINQFVKQIENKTDGKVYSCLGNHDYNISCCQFTRPVNKFIIKKHNNLHYDFVSHDIHFICCSIYPNKNIRLWLNLILKKNRCKKIIFFHYNLLGEDSEWWSETEKNLFYEVIKNYSIICLCVGHGHVSSTYKWKDIQVITSAGSSVGLCEINENFEIDIKFIY